MKLDGAGAGLCSPSPELPDRRVVVLDWSTDEDADETIFGVQNKKICPPRRNTKG